VNIRDLRYLVAVADLRHFGHAAEACFVSQPTLSGQIKKLEEQLGVILFERTPRSVELTPIGARIIEQARQILEEVADMESLARSAHDPLAGPLHIGAIHTISPYVMPEVMAPLRDKYPQMELALHEDITENLTRDLLTHKIDVALLATPITENELIELPLYEEPFWFAHAEDDPYARDPVIEEHHLTHSELLLLTDGHCLADQVLDLCRPGTLRDQARGMLRAASLETLIRLVGKGFGCTLIPALAVQKNWLKGLGVVARPIPLPHAHRKVSLVYRRSFPRPAAIEAVAQVIRTSLGARVTLIE